MSEPSPWAETGQEGPVTVVVVRRARPGREAELEAWLRDVIAVTARFPGYLGSFVMRPRGALQPEHVLVFRFARADDLRAWQTSTERTEWLARAVPFTEHVEVREQQGLEPFFDLPAQRGLAPPPRWKMALVTWIAIYPLIIGVAELTGPFLGSLPFAVETLVGSGITVLLMAYLVMPRMTRLFARFLYPR